MDSSFWDERYDGAELVWTAEPNVFVVEAAEDLEPGTALDLAGGEGRNAVWLAERGWRATVADFSPVGLAKAVELAGRRGVDVATLEADAVTWDPPAEGFDLVVLAYLQLASPAIAQALARAGRALAPGGRLLVVAHHADNPTQGFGGPPDASVCYSEADVVSALPELEVIRAERRERVVETDDGPKVALDAVVLLRRRPAA